jgi:hypothetical protein
VEYGFGLLIGLFVIELLLVALQPVFEAPPQPLIKAPRPAREKGFAGVTIEKRCAIFLLKRYLSVHGCTYLTIGQRRFLASL